MFLNAAFPLSSFDTLCFFVSLLKDSSHYNFVVQRYNDNKVSWILNVENRDRDTAMKKNLDIMFLSYRPALTWPKWSFFSGCYKSWISITAMRVP